MAFQDIYETLLDDIYRYVRGQTRCDADAEDVVSDVFLRAWRSAAKYRTGSNTYRQWIFTIARNRVRSHWAALAPVSELTAGLAAEAEDEQRTDPAELRRIIAAALCQLNPEQRDVVVMRYFLGKSHAEIGATLGKREPAVRASLLRALRRLRKVIGDVEI